MYGVSTFVCDVSILLSMDRGCEYTHAWCKYTCVPGVDWFAKHWCTVTG